MEKWLPINSDFAQLRKFLTNAKVTFEIEDIVLTDGEFEIVMDGKIYFNFNDTTGALVSIEYPTKYDF